jgi:hypothetical protein
VNSLTKFSMLTPSPPDQSRPLILKTRSKLPVGWEAFQIYPPFNPDVWQPSVAPLWAELDVLATVAAHNLQSQRYHALDPRAAARKEAQAVLREFEALLDGQEAPLQTFLTKHPELLCPTYKKVWEKAPFGTRVSDFVFREPSDEYFLVEIEAPIRPLFRKKGTQPHEALVHAQDQITDWLRYIEDNLDTVQRELGLSGISTTPHCLIVIGRSASLTPAGKRKLTTMQNMTPKLTIMTYDDLLANARATFENLLGPLWDPGGQAEVYYLPRP